VTNFTILDWSCRH